MFQRRPFGCSGSTEAEEAKKKINKNCGSKSLSSESPNHLEMQTWGNEWDMLILPWKKHLWRRPVLPEKFRGMNVTSWNNAPTCFMRKKDTEKLQECGIKSLTRNPEIARREARKCSLGCPEAVLDMNGCFVLFFWGGLLFGLNRFGLKLTSAKYN